MTQGPIDPIWTVLKPRNGSPEAIEEMNAKAFCFHPALARSRQADHRATLEAHAVIQKDFSVSALFERLGQLEAKANQ